MLYVCIYLCSTVTRERAEFHFVPVVWLSGRACCDGHCRSVVKRTLVSGTVESVTSESSQGEPLPAPRGT